MMGEFFVEPEGCEFEGCPVLKGEPKIYRMAYDQGFPHITVESYYNQGVTVYYANTGQTWFWKWQNRNLAWDFAKMRKQHIHVIAGGGYNAHLYR